jgi:O-antigen/teichoic acid export membrane protein
MTEPDPSGSVHRNAVIALGTQVITGLFTAVITLFLVRELDASGFGIFTLTLSIVGLVALPADFGISLAAARYIAERRDQPREIAAVVTKALALKLALLGLFAGALMLAAGPLSSLYGEPDLETPLRVAALSLLGQNLVFFFANAFVAMGRISSQFLLVALESAAEATATIALVLIAGGATAALCGRLIGYTFGALAGVLIIWRRLGTKSFAERSGGPRMRALIGYAGAMLIIDGAYAVFSQVDILVVGAVLGTVAAGIYGAPLRLIVLLTYIGVAIAQAVAPRLARHPNIPPDVGALAGGLRLLLIVQTAFATIAFVWAGPLVELALGPGYEGSVDVLRALAPFILLSGIGPLVSTAVNYMGETRRRLPIAIGCAVLNVASTIWLVNLIGVTGAAFSLDITYAIYVFAHLRLCLTLLNMDGRPLVSAAVRTVPAAGALFLVLTLAGTENLTAAGWILGIVGGAVVYLAALVATRATTTAELFGLPQRLRDAVR